MICSFAYFDSRSGFPLVGLHIRQQQNQNKRNTKIDFSDDLCKDKLITGARGLQP
jgi:hypothetical protein